MGTTIGARLDQDMKAALKAGEAGKTALSVIRLARAALHNAEIDKRRPLTEEEAAEVRAREAKQRREAAEEYARLGRPDAAEALQREIAVIERYLPPPLSDEELRELAREAIAATGAATARDLGKVMGRLMPAIRGRADGRRASDLVRELLPEA